MKSDAYGAVATPETTRIPKVGFVSLGCTRDIGFIPMVSCE